MKKKKSPHLNPLPKGEEEKESLSVSIEKIFQKLSRLEEQLKKMEDHALKQTCKPLNFREACTFLGYAPSYLYKLTYQKIIPHYKPTGKMIFFSKYELDEWIIKSGKEQAARDEQRNGSTSSSTGSELRLTTGDPNQVDLFENDCEGKKEKRKEEKNESEIVIEFPLKSRRGKI